MGWGGRVGVDSSVTQSLCKMGHQLTLPSCLQVPTGSNGYTFKCSPPVRGRIVIVQLQQGNYLTLCEVEVAAAGKILL